MSSLECQKSASTSGGHSQGWGDVHSFLVHVTHCFPAPPKGSSHGQEEGGCHREIFPRFTDSNKTKEILQARKAPPATINGHPSVSATTLPCGQAHSWGNDRKSRALEGRMLVPAESSQSALLEPMNFWPKIPGYASRKSTVLRGLVKAAPSRAHTSVTQEKGREPLSTEPNLLAHPSLAKHPHSACT